MLRALLVCASVLVVDMARADWPANGVQLTVLPSAPDFSVSASDGAGGCFVHFRDTSNGFAWSTMATHVSGSGVLDGRWGPTGTPIGTSPVDTYFPDAIEPDGTGGAFYLYSYYYDRPPFPTDHGYGLYLRRLSADAQDSPGWPSSGRPVRLGQVDDVSMVRLHADALDGVGIAFTRNRSSSLFDSEVWLDRIAPDGSPPAGWPDSGIVVCRAIGQRYAPRVLSDGAGGVFAVWNDLRSGGEQAFANHLSSAGTLVPGWRPDGSPVTDSLHTQIVNGAASDGAGGFFVVVKDGRVDPNGDIYLHHIRGDGTRAPGWPASGIPVCGAPNIQQNAHIIADGAGGAILAWDDYRTSGAIDIYAIHVAADGTRLPGWPVDGLIISTAPGDAGALNNTPRMVSDGQGGAFIGWQQGTTYDIWIEHFSPNGQPAPGWTPGGVTVRDPSLHGVPDDYELSVDGQGGAFAVWSESRDAIYDQQLFIQRYGATGIVATDFSAASITAADGAVRLEWATPERPATELTVFRRDDASAWQSIGTTVVRANGLAEFVDLTAAAGGRFAYRVATSGLSPRYSPESWVDVPASYRFSLEGARPNPAIGASFSVAFSLRTHEPASLELIDLAGRRVLSTDVSSLGPGAHVMSLTQGSRVEPGVYWVRLSQGAQSASMRAVVIR